MVAIPPANGFIPDPPGEDDDRFARSFKNWREWNVVVNFLTNLHIGVDESAVFSLTTDPPDVVFRDARFEVKEIMDPGRRRHDEAKAARSQADRNGGKGSVVQYTPKDLTPSDVGGLILQELDKLTAKSYTVEQRRGMDLLFYVNKLEHWFENGPVPEPRAFEAYGWRSVSAVVDTQQGIVFDARPDAPSFLLSNVGKVRERWASLEDDA